MSCKSNGGCKSCDKCPTDKTISVKLTIAEANLILEAINFYSDGEAAKIAADKISDAF